ncbi:MAG: IMP cyclohydrolase [Nitrospirae bacterium]|nr:IMP cyclohydrolase [Nitrospirota bacterium]MBF0534543.1 IMP cyclohydrolase [Nitrospirota bacterium]MBF0617578.1 IMP cyclohydrolase [Nitrospirota bacterium]
MSKTAIISVTDKTGIVDFAKGLKNLGFDILSTGGTAKSLRDGGLTVTEVSDYTKFPEILDGRVKTLHPKIYGGILALRDNPSHVETIKAHSINSIDMVVVNLYAFEKTVEKEGVTFDEAVENIDIGGPTLLRAAAKNSKHVTVITDPADYPSVLMEMGENDGQLTIKTRLSLGTKVFSVTSAYDAAIYKYLSGFNK